MWSPGAKGRGREQAGAEWEVWRWVGGGGQAGFRGPGETAVVYFYFFTSNFIEA